jgi:hypothetical protein
MNWAAARFQHFLEHRMSTDMKTSSVPHSQIGNGPTAARDLRTIPEAVRVRLLNRANSMRKPDLPHYIKKLCAQVAHEEMKRAVWRRAAEIKAEFQDRLARGELVEDAETELQARFMRALVEQYRRDLG